MKEQWIKKEKKWKKYKVRVYIRLRESVSDAAGNAVKANCNKVAPDIKVEN